MFNLSRTFDECLYGLHGKDRDNVKVLFEKTHSIPDEKINIASDRTLSIFIPIIRRIYTLLTDTEISEMYSMRKHYGHVMPDVVANLDVADIFDFIDRKCKVFQPVVNEFRFTDLEAELACMMAVEYVGIQCEFAANIAEQIK